MKKSVVMLCVAGLLLLLGGPAQANMNLLWDIPADLDTKAYLQALQEKTGAKMELRWESDSTEDYCSVAGADLELCGLPALLTVSFTQGRLTCAGQIADADSLIKGDEPAQRDEAKRALLDYQQELVEKMSAELGAPTGGIMFTDYGGTIDPKNIWSYPGTEDGKLNRDQTDAAMEMVRINAVIHVYWDNVCLTISWGYEDGLWLYGAVDYYFDSTRTEGFEHGEPYPTLPQPCPP